MQSHLLLRSKDCHEHVFHGLVRCFLTNNGYLSRS